MTTTGPIVALGNDGTMDLKRWADDHSMSLILIPLIAVFFGASFVAGAQGWSWAGVEIKDTLQGMAHDTYGAWVVVFLAKYFREIGSKELDDEQSEAE